MMMKHWIAKTSACALVFAALGLNGCGEVTHEDTTPPAPPPRADAVPVAKPQEPKTSVVVYEMPKTLAQDKTADPSGLIPQPVFLPARTADPMRQAAIDLTTNTNSPLPHGTTLRSVTLDKASGLATIDFSKEFQTNFPGGDEREAQIVNSVLATLGQFPDVQNVQFLIEGKKIGSLGGTQDLTNPLPAIRPGQMTGTDTAGVPQPVASNP